jgi:hypothetical protein
MKEMDFGQVINEICVKSSDSEFEERKNFISVSLVLADKENILLKRHESLPSFNFFCSKRERKIIAKKKFPFRKKLS